MTEPTNTTAANKARGRQLFYILMMVALLIWIARLGRDIYRKGQGDGDRERIRAQAAEQARRQAPGPTTPSR